MAYMKSILVNKRIGDSWWESGITAEFMRRELESYDQEDNKVQIVIDSPGGSVWECISIFNIIRNFMRQHKEVTVETYIQGMAASSASIIALAPKYDPPIPITTKISELDCIFLEAFFILSNSSLS